MKDGWTRVAAASQAVGGIYHSPIGRCTKRRCFFSSVFKNFMSKSVRIGPLTHTHTTQHAADERGQAANKWLVKHMLTGTER
jgi:hypothetical protein